MNFRNMHVATKLWLAVAVIIISLTVLIAFAALRSARLQAESETTLRALNSRVNLASRDRKSTRLNSSH